MRKPEIFVFLLCSLFCLDAVAQNDSDSVRQLKTVTVQQSRLNDYVIASYELPLDSSVLTLSSNGSLTDLLRKQGFGHIRSYGSGGLASPSFRGTGSSHTAVLWNGINLVSPLSGQLDLSLVPAALFDDATIQTGGSTSLSGNGSIGANIHLNNNLNFNEGLRVTGSSFIGSFESQYHDAGVKFSSKTFGMSTKIFVNSSENDFTFINRNASPDETRKREHSAFDQHGLLQQLHWNAQDAGIFSLKLWYQNNFREMPNPTGIPRPSEATENNKFYRVLAGWNFSEGITDINYQAAFLRQDLNYSDPVADEYALNRYTSTVHNLETNVNFANRAQLTSGIHYTWEDGAVTDFGGSSPARNRVAFFTAYKFDPGEKWKLAISGREELVNGDPMPFSPTVSAKYSVIEKLHVFTNLSRNYRIPTFNDLFWQGAGAQGNPDLKTEVSLSAEAGLAFSKETISFKSAGFTNHVDNWILWSPTGVQLWMPQNIKKVWSRGVESQLSASTKQGVFQARLTGQYSYTRSTNVDIYNNGNPNEKGKQLLLTPVHEGSASLEGKWRTLTLRIVSSYTGQQFNTSDNLPSEIVDDYLITNVWLSKGVRKKDIAITFTGEINNLFDKAYVARPGYPMPGINFKAGININFHKTNKQ